MPELQSSPKFQLRNFCNSPNSVNCVLFHGFSNFCGYAALFAVNLRFTVSPTRSKGVYASKGAAELRVFIESVSGKAGLFRK
jgi:hypothetical protein